MAWLVFDIPMRGSLALLFGAGGIYLVVALGVGLWISTVTETQQQAMFVTYFFLMIDLFMSGLFTPIASMPGWGRAAAELIPLKHFIEIARAVLVKGAGADALVVPLWRSPRWGSSCSPSRCGSTRRQRAEPADHGTLRIRVCELPE